jgi:hypothetical protein
MKTLRLVLLLTPLLLLPMTRLAVAGPATVIPPPFLVGCEVAWVGIETDNLPHVVLLPARGILVETNNSRGNAMIDCKGEIDFGATTTAVDIVTGLPVSVRLLTIAEECSLNPAACRGGGNGALIFNFANTGLPCAFPAGVTTTYSERVTPSGEAQVTCHLP